MYKQCGHDKTINLVVGKTYYKIGHNYMASAVIRHFHLASRGWHKCQKCISQNQLNVIKFVIFIHRLSISYNMNVGCVW